MAEITHVVCPTLAASKGTHCWHTIWVPSSVQPGQQDGSEMRCCWCGEKRPLQVEYAPPVQHGPHLPADPRPSTIAGGGYSTTYYGPIFGDGGIPIK